MDSSSVTPRALKRQQVIVSTKQNRSWAGPNLRGGNARWLLALATLTLTAAAHAQAPNAVLDTFPNVPEDSVNFLMDVAANDTPLVDIDLTSVVLQTQAINGIAAANGDGTFNYTPGANYIGPDSFNYTVCTFVPECSIGSVDITVTSVNDIPVLTLNGVNPLPLGTGDTYNDPGASATDVEDNDVALTNSISVGGDVVDTDVPATYTATYDVTDSDLAPAVQITRDVVVTDDDAPVITLTLPTTIDLNVGDPYSDPGFSATDNVDGVITGNVVVAGDPVTTGIPGTYVVTYNVSDLAGNAATQQTRTINVSTPPDVTPPVITLTPPTTIELDVGDPYSDPGFSAIDNVDGDITGNVIVGGDVVNTSVANTYVVTYNVSDAAGNPATQRTRTINVNDVNPPIISRIGPATVNLNVGDAYNEQGATALDPEEGSVPVVIGGAVITNTVGVYIITYDASDSAGNNAAQVTRTVNVTDGNPPVITRIGPPIINLNVGDTYNEQGATALDPEEGSVPVTIGGAVNTNAVGTYIVTYDASDSAGNNAAQVTRTVNVNDGNPPVISLIGPPTVNLNVGDTYNEQGATALDPEEGSVPVTIGGAVNTNAVGTYIVTYNASDSAGNNAAQVTRTVNVNDGNPPIISLNGLATINLNVGDAYNEQGATALDPEEGSVPVTIAGAVNTNIPGTYLVTYNASDSAGNNAAQVTRTVNVADTNGPVISLNGPATIRLNVGDAYNEQGATALDPEEGAVPVTIGGDTVNTGVAGTYVVTYNASDSAGNAANQVIRTIIVNSPPVITITGDNPVTVAEGTVYTDAGATASDAEDGDLTASINVANTVNTSVPGGYTVTYTVTDSAGSTDTEIRSVTVGNNAGPVITGQNPLTTAEETPLTITLADLIISDPDSPPSAFILNVQDGANYARVGNTITPALNFFGDLSVPVTVDDEISTSPVFNLVVTVTDVNDPPIAIPQAVSTDEDIPVAITLVGSDTENNLLTFAISAQPVNGVLSGTAPDVTYTPNLDFNGVDSFTFTVDDGGLTSAPALVTITVNAINDPPTVSTPIEDQVAVEGSPFDLTITGNFTDSDGDPLSYIATGLPLSGNIVFNGLTGVFSGTPRQEDARDNDPYLITVTATDGDLGGITAVDEFALNVSALDRANVSLDISVTPDPAMLNDTLTWTYTVRNTVGPQVAPNVILTGSFFGEGLTVTTTSGCNIQAPVGQVTNFDCTIGMLPVGALTSAILSTSTSVVGDVATFAVAAGADVLPIDPNIDDNSEQTAVGVAAAFSNGAVDVLGNSNVRSVAFGDVNGDMAGDLIVGTSAGQPIQIWLSDGFRDFGTSPLTIADTASNEGIALADFNGDGRLDMVVANGGGASDMVYANDGLGNFTTMATLGLSFSQGVAVGDFDNDNNMDVVFATIQGNPVYLGTGSGGFTPHATLGAANSQAVAVAKFNADGRDDVVFANIGSGSTVWTKNGGAGFTTRSLLAIGDAISVTVGEFGGDASPDLAFGRVSAGVGDVPANPVLINDGTGLFGIPTVTLGAAPTTGIHTGDVDNDSRDDLVFINASGVHQVWINNGAGFTLSAQQIVSDGSADGVVGQLGFTDVSDPGGADLAMGGAFQPGLGIYLNDGFGNLGRGDAVAPTLTLTGEAAVTVPSGGTYTDAGATALDNIDGNISSSIVVDNPVNVAVVGNYTVTYNVSDFAGNAATSISRTVAVSPATGRGGGGGGAMTLFTLALLLFAAALMYQHQTSARAMRRARIRIDQKDD